MMKNEDFDFYSQYKKKWILPLLFSIILIVSIVCCFVFHCKCEIAYDISLSIFTGSLVFFLTQLILYINKKTKIKMQQDKDTLFTIKYKLSQIINRLKILYSLDKEEDYIELKNILKESYKLIYKNKRDITRISKILAKRIDCIFWTYLFFISKELERVSHDDFMQNANACITIGNLTIKYCEILEYFNKKICVLSEQISELYNDFNLFYENQKQKISDEIF